MCGSRPRPAARRRYAGSRAGGAPAPKAVLSVGGDSEKANASGGNNFFEEKKMLY